MNFLKNVQGKNTDNLNKNDSNDNSCIEKQQQQECQICNCKKLDTIENKVD
jgi:hypothetical protein